jgi:hypothetical protein
LINRFARIAELFRTRGERLMVAYIL